MINDKSKFNRRTLLRYAATGLSFLHVPSIMYCSDASANSYAEMMEWYGSFLEAQIPKYRKIYRSNMSSDERNIEQNIRYRVTRNDINNARAYRENGKRIVEIFVGIIRSTETIAEMRSYALLNNDKSISGEYLDYLTEEIGRRIASGNPEKETDKIKLFPSYVGMSDTQYRKFIGNQVVEANMEFQMNSSLLWLVGHEIGHQLLNHNGSQPNNIRISQEEDADDIGFRLMKGSGYNGIGSIPVMLAFAVWDPETSDFRKNRTHPTPIARLEKQIRKGSEEALSDPDFVQYMRERGTEDMFHREVEEGISVLRNLRVPKD